MIWNRINKKDIASERCERNQMDNQINQMENQINSGVNFKKIIKIGLFLFLILSLTSCAPAGVTEHEYGFFGGLWHGFIITFSLIGYLFFDIGLLAEANTGLTYYIGCGLGMLIMGIISLGRL